MSMTPIKLDFGFASLLKISQEKSVEIISQLRGEYRIIAPIRRADHAAREFARKNSN